MIFKGGSYDGKGCEGLLCDILQDDVLAVSTRFYSGPISEFMLMRTGEVYSVKSTSDFVDRTVVFRTEATYAGKQKSTELLLTTNWKSVR